MLCWWSPSQRHFWAGGCITIMGHLSTFCGTIIVIMLGEILAVWLNILPCIFTDIPRYPVNWIYSCFNLMNILGRKSNYRWLGFLLQIYLCFTMFKWNWNLVGNTAVSSIFFICDIKTSLSKRLFSCVT